MSAALKFGAQGVKLKVAGRLGGAEMSRVVQYMEGRVPLHTLRAQIDFGFWEARCPYGVIGVKCWVFSGYVPDAKLHEHRLGAPEEAQSR
jgi:small subunit ribosomal protein S3